MGELQGPGEGSEDGQGGSPSMAEDPEMKSWATMLQPELPSFKVSDTHIC